LFSCPRVVVFNNAFTQLVFFFPGKQRRLVNLLKIIFYGTVEYYKPAPARPKISRLRLTGPTRFKSRNFMGLHTS
jgi:hypothetical protein